MKNDNKITFICTNYYGIIWEFFPIPKTFVILEIEYCIVKNCMAFATIFVKKSTPKSE